VKSGLTGIRHKPPEGFETFGRLEGDPSRRFRTSGRVADSRSLAASRGLVDLVIIVIVIILLSRIG